MGVVINFTDQNSVSLFYDVTVALLGVSFCFAKCDMFYDIIMISPSQLGVSMLTTPLKRRELEGSTVG